MLQGMEAGSLTAETTTWELVDAVLETYHEGPGPEDELDWNLIGDTRAGEQVLLSGTCVGAITAGSPLVIHHIDQPDRVVVDGAPGMLVTTPDQAACTIAVVELDGERARLRADLVLEWVALREGVPSRNFPLRVDVVATRRSAERATEDP